MARPRLIRAGTRTLLGLLAAAVLAGCGEPAVDPTPEKLNGSSSYEFEADDIEAASDAVKDYCAGAVSEAQRVGCESRM